jgi:hypothetical protein
LVPLELGFSDIFLGQPEFGEEQVLSVSPASSGVGRLYISEDGDGGVIGRAM